MRTKPLSIVCVCVCVCIYIHALMTCKCVGIMCGGNRDPERKKAKNKKEWCLPSHKKRFQAFRVLKFRVFGGVFLVSYRKHHLIIIKEKNFWGVFEYSIRAKNNTRQKRSSSRDTISFLLSLSLLLLLLLLLWLFWVQQQQQPTKGASTTSLSLLCDVVLKIQKERERERETYRKERHTHA